MAPYEGMWTDIIGITACLIMAIPVIGLCFTPYPGEKPSIDNDRCPYCGLKPPSGD